MNLFEFDNIMIPISSGGSRDPKGGALHWLLGRIHVPTRRTLIYEPYGGGNFNAMYWLTRLESFRDDLFVKKFEMIQQLTSAATGGPISDAEKQNLTTIKNSAWTHDHNYTGTKKYSQQGDCSACAVFVMMWIAYLLKNKEANLGVDVTQERCAGVFRTWLTRMLCEDAVRAEDS
jgi:hypothetical protein